MGLCQFAHWKYRASRERRSFIIKFIVASILIGIAVAANYCHVYGNRVMAFIHIFFLFNFELIFNFSDNYNRIPFCIWFDRLYYLNMCCLEGKERRISFCQFIIDREMSLPLVYFINHSIFRQNVWPTLNAMHSSRSHLKAIKPIKWNGNVFSVLHCLMNYLNWLQWTHATMVYPLW